MYSANIFFKPTLLDGGEYLTPLPGHLIFGSGSRYPLCRSLGWVPGRTEMYEEEKNLLIPKGIRTPNFNIEGILNVYLFFVT